MKEIYDYKLLVRSLRERLGLTQEQFAAKLGVTFPTINRWENGKAKPSPLGIKQVEDLINELGKDGLDLSRKYLLKGNNK